MGSFSRVSGGVGAAMLAGGMLATASPAWSMAHRPRVIPVRCSSGALAASIVNANANANANTDTDTAVLRLRPRCVYTITTPATAATGLPDITGNVTLVGGPSTTIRRDPAAAAFRILNVTGGGTLRVLGVAVLDGRTGVLGGGIQNAGTLVVRQSTLSGNTAMNGGAIANLAGATATISRSLFSGNTTTSAGGGGLINLGTATVFGSVFVANTAPINGGAVNTQPTAVTRLIQTTVDRNTSGGPGGGISNLGTTSLVRTLVRFNRGPAGGGIATGNTRVTLARSLVRNNLAGNCSPASTIPGCTG
jgi:hypothetical protein